MTYPISLNLNQKQAPSLKQMQRLIMSPQMQQALNLLQLPVMELSALIEIELEQNPILESGSDQEQDDQDMEQINMEVEEVPEETAAPTEKELLFDDHDFEIMKQLDEEFKDHFDESSTYRKQRTVDDDKLASFLENSIHSELSLFGHLMQQAQETFSTEEEIKIAESIIGSLDERGILQTSLEEIAMLYGFKYDQVARVLAEIQKFEPSGVGAQTIQEALLLQLTNQGKNKSLAYKVVESHYQDLIHNRIPLIQRQLKCSSEEISQAIEKDIAKLDLHPGTSFSHEIVQQIVPDITIHQENETLIVTIPDEFLPSFRLNSRYLKMLEDETLTVETKDFIKQKLLSARWLMRNISQRNETLEKIAKFLVEKQAAFFLSPDGKLVPMTMKMLAEDLGVHESTIARAVSNKYLYCPRGIFPLRSFFTNTYINDQGEDVSSQTVRDVLLEVIKNENKKKPLSDEAIAAAIKERGILCARRTVAKYRAALQIGNAHQRKKFS
jgi:RNA polymerase sigma-54 factor